jgi:hypothetical protein
MNLLFALTDNKQWGLRLANGNLLSSPCHADLCCPVFSRSAGCLPHSEHCDAMIAMKNIAYTDIHQHQSAETGQDCFYVQRKEVLP